MVASWWRTGLGGKGGDNTEGTPQNSFRTKKVAVIVVFQYYYDGQQSFTPRRVAGFPMMVERLFGTGTLAGGTMVNPFT